MFIHPPAAVAGKEKYNVILFSPELIMLYKNRDEAREALKVFVPEQVSESLFKKGDVVTVTKDEFDIVYTDEKGDNNALSAKIIIKRGEETIERTVTLRTLFGTIRTDIPEGLEENVDVILPYAKAKYESRFQCPYNVADAIKNYRLPDDWTFEVVEKDALVNQYVDRKNDDIDGRLKLKTMNGQKHVNGLYRLKKVTISARK